MDSGEKGLDKGWCRVGLGGLICGVDEGMLIMRGCCVGEREDQLLA